MGDNMNLNNLIKSIFDYAPDGPNIHHLMAVHGYSRMIAQEVIFEQVPKALGIHKREVCGVYKKLKIFRVSPLRA